MSSSWSLCPNEVFEGKKGFLTVRVWSLYPVVCVVGGIWQNVLTFHHTKYRLYDAFPLAICAPHELIVTLHLLQLNVTLFDETYRDT